MTRRAPHVAIALVAAMLLLSYATHRRVGGLKWPVQVWNMYAGKTNLDPVVKWRRFVAHLDDGRDVATDLSPAAAFLGKPYRVDAGLNRDLPGLLVACLRLMTEQDRHLVGLSYEARVWSYRQHTLAEHLTLDPAARELRVEWVAPAPAGDTSLPNGDFSDWEPRSGQPAGWKVDAPAFMGLGLAREGDGRALLLAEAPGRRAQAAHRELALPASGGTLTVTARLLTRSGEGHVELSTLEGPAVRSPSVPADGVWHEITVSTPYAPGAKSASLRLVATGAVFFDNVSTRLDP
jgi:hypothetical protein